MVEYTRWIQALVLKNLGLCPYCEQKLPGSPLSGVKNLGNDTGFEMSDRLKDAIERSSSPPSPPLSVWDDPAPAGLQAEAPLKFSPGRGKIRLPSLDELIEKHEAQEEPLDTHDLQIDWIAEHAKNLEDEFDDEASTA